MFSGFPSYELGAASEGLGTVEDVGDEVGFAGEVGVAVVAELGGQGFLEVAVLLGGFEVGAEVVAEGDVALELAALRWADVEVVADGVRGSEEGFALGMPRSPWWM